MSAPESHISTPAVEMLVERPRRARARARAQAHQRLGTFSRRAAHRTAHGNHLTNRQTNDDPAARTSLYARGSPSSRPRDGGFAEGARTREDIRLPQRSEDRRRGGLTTEYNEFAELSRQTVEFLNADMTTVRETLYDVVYDDDGVNGDRDALGRITKKTEWIVSGDTPNGDGTPRGLDSRTYDYGYNQEGRPWLESVAVDGNVVSSYSYDDNGNRTSVESSWSQLGYDAKFDVSLSEADTEYDSADKLLTYGSKSYEWNNFGQLESMTDSDPDGDPGTNDAETTFYQYDLFGNLLRVDLPDGRAIEYDVDGAGRRVGRRELDAEGIEISRKGWIYRDGLRPVAELDNEGKVVARFVYTGVGGANHPTFASTYNGAGNLIASYKILTDNIGSFRGAIDIETGQIVDRVEYDEFGRTLFGSSRALQHFGFAGGIYDSDTGLLRFGLRDYAPEIGRWTAREPLLFIAGDANTYTYAGSDPINYVDVDGLCGERAGDSKRRIASILSGTGKVLAVGGFIVGIAGVYTGNPALMAGGAMAAAIGGGLQMAGKAVNDAAKVDDAMETGRQMQEIGDDRRDQIREYDDLMGNPDSQSGPADTWDEYYETTGDEEIKWGPEGAEENDEADDD